jgi:nitroimidazol reductase NimA-like FMN-containing flavoprotein (pyridoxamine 5'-phosphate oxidase superfamily)
VRASRHHLILAVESDKRTISMSELDEFLAKPHLARMATANPDTQQPHVVPVWYGWDGTSLWIGTFRSTRKIKELLRNPRISVVIDIDHETEGLRAAILEGEAELVNEPRAMMEEKTEWIYTRYLGPEGVKAKDPQSWIKDPEALLIKLTPKWVKTWK